jgi:hypothetical protein
MEKYLNNRVLLLYIKGEIIMFVVLSKECVELLKERKFLGGYRDYDAMITKLLNVPVTPEELQKSIDYIKNGRKSPIKLERAKAISKYLDSLIKACGIGMPEEDSTVREDLLRLKMFCEEYLR